MATKETRSSLTKHIEKEKSESPEGVKKRGRKPKVLQEKSSSAPNSPLPTRKRKVGEEGRQTPQPTTRGIKKLEDEDLTKNTPSPFSRSRKSFLEKELEDLLENATGRNTPSLPRTRKIMDKEEDVGLVLPTFSRSRRDIDDDMISVRSFSTRGKKNTNDDDTSSIRSFVMRTKKTDSTTSEEVKSEKPKVEEVVVQKKKLGRPRKYPEAEPKVKELKKRGRPPLNGPKSRTTKAVKKQITHKVKLSTKRRLLRSALIKKKILMKSPLKKKAVVEKLLKVKHGRIGRLPRKIKSDEDEENDNSMKKMNSSSDEISDKLLKTNKNVTKTNDSLKKMSTSSEESSDRQLKSTKNITRTSDLMRKISCSSDELLKTNRNVPVVEEKIIKKRMLKKSQGASDGDTKDVYMFSENETAEDSGTNVKQKVRRLLRENDVKEEKEVVRKRKRERSIHFDSERSPDDSSVIIVKPRFGPKKTKKDLLEEEVMKKMSSTSPPLVQNPYLVISTAPSVVPKFKNPIVNPNFNHEKPIGPRNLPYIEKEDDCVGSDFPKIPSEFILTSGGLVLSSASANTIKTPSIIFQNLTLGTDISKAQLVYPGTPVNMLSLTASGHSVEQRRDSLPVITNTNTCTTEQGRLSTCTDTNKVSTSEEIGISVGAVDEEKNSKQQPNQCFIYLQEGLPKIPVAKNVTDLFMLKEKAQENLNNREGENKPPVLERMDMMEDVDSENQSPATDNKSKTKKNCRKLLAVGENGKRRRNSEVKLRIHSPCDKKTFSSINLTTPVVECKRKTKKRRRNVRKNTLEGDVIFSDPETSYQSSPTHFTSDKCQSTENLCCDYINRPNIKEEKLSSDIKPDSSVFNFSKENQDVLKELGLDSDLEKSDVDVKVNIENVNCDAVIDLDAALKEVSLPIFTKLSSSSPSRPELKLNFKSVTPPTVIDILLEKNKSLKKAEEEGILGNKLQESIRSFNECSKTNLREFRTKKFTKGVESKRKMDKLQCRRGSNPETCSVMPLRRITDNNIPRRVSHDDVEKVAVGNNRRLSLSEEFKTDVNVDVENCEKGVNNERRVSYESSSSCSDNFSKIIDELNNLEESRKDKKVPYHEDSEQNSLVSKLRLSAENKDGKTIEENPEDLANKETILSALGLQSLKAAAQNAQKKKEMSMPCAVATAITHPPYSSNYTGTLKTVIKIQRPDKKGNSKSPVKMIYKSVSSVHEASTTPSLNDDLNVNGQNSAANSSVDHDTDNTSREGSEEANSDENKSSNSNGKAKSLVIPEKASSFSIHPGRMCSDVCTYCFGKFGLLDTPCHVAQLKDSERRRNILRTEIHLTADSCLCDACFRHVDKKSNCPTFTDKKYKRKYTNRKHSVCTALNCNTLSTHHVRRRSYTKLKKSIGRKLILDQGKLEKLQTGNIITLCQAHMYWIDFFMSCGICKKRLTNVNMYRINNEVNELNMALSSDGIPTILTDKRFLCKVCKCYASIRIKFKDPADLSGNHRQFYETCRKRILYCHGIEVPDSEPDNEKDQESCQKNGKMSKKKNKTSNQTLAEGKQDHDEIPRDIEMTVEKEKEKEEDYDEDDVLQPTAATTAVKTKTNSRQVQHVSKLGQDGASQNTSRPDLTIHECYPTEKELPLIAHFDFNEDESAKQARHGFEKFTATIQFNRETKELFKDLQMPYGNQSSFMRHLVLLEKYFRNGDLVVSRNADSKAVGYISSVQNRIRSYEGMMGGGKKQEHQQHQQQQHYHHSAAKQQPSVTVTIPLPTPVTLPSQPQILNLTPSVTILPQPKTDKFMPSLNPIHTEKTPSVSLLPSRPFTLTPMSLAQQTFQIAKTTVTPVYSSESPLSQMQATVQNITSKVPHLGNSITLTTIPQPIVISTKPELTIVTVMNNNNNSSNSLNSVSGGKTKMVSLLPPNPILTTKLQENLRNLAAKNKVSSCVATTQTTTATTTKSSTASSSSNSTRAVILNRTVGGQKQSFVQVTTGGKTIHLTLSQFKRIQQMQMRKKQYLERDRSTNKTAKHNKTQIETIDDDDEDEDEMCPTDNLQVEIQEINNTNDKDDIFPKISNVRSLAKDETNELQWDSTMNVCNGPKMKPLSVSVTKLPLKSDSNDV